MPFSLTAKNLKGLGGVRFKHELGQFCVEGKQRQKGNRIRFRCLDGIKTTR